MPLSKEASFFRLPHCAACRHALPPLERLQVDGETVSLMVPCADMANHVMSPNAGYAFDASVDAFRLTALRVGWAWVCGRVGLQIAPLLGKAGGAPCLPLILAKTPLLAEHPC